ncbi:hypothetical protein LEP1GSC168_0811 [Leptospira santarosai str. HAI134]|nr:hypothetical protein LEP1GSC168_0811 [Leptospira santarosai str. HAI134]
MNYYSQFLKVHINSSDRQDQGKSGIDFGKNPSDRREVYRRSSAKLRTADSLKDKTESFTVKHKLPDFPASVKVRDNIKEVTVRVNIFASVSNAGETLLLGIPIKCQSLDRNLEAEFSEPEVR